MAEYPRNRIELKNVAKDITIMTLKGAYRHLFYNQDWYEEEAFAHRILDPGVHQFSSENGGVTSLPSAVSCVWAFIRLYESGKDILWPSEYVWCWDTDAAGDQVYVGGWALGRKKGLQIHRHLALKPHHISINYAYHSI